jgi:deoxypyrimidine-specific 5' nucleotidase type C protein (NT5C)
VPLRIGFDLDGVLADMDGALLHEAQAIFGDDVVREMRPSRDGLATGDEGQPDAEAAIGAPSIAKLNMTPRQRRRLWEHVTTIHDFWQSLDEIEHGSIARLARLVAERQWEVIFLTKRPQTAGATAQIQSQRWLESRGFPLPSLFVVQGSRGRIASALSLDVVVDDRPENCFDVVADSQAKAILIWRESPEALPSAAQRLGVAVVGSVAECLNLLESVDARAPDGESILSRFKRLLGIKQRTDA